MPLRSNVSLSMNRGLMAAGLGDRVRVDLPGDHRSDRVERSSGAAVFDLELIDHRTLDGHTQELIYRPTLHD